MLAPMTTGTAYCERQVPGAHRDDHHAGGDRGALHQRRGQDAHGQPGKRVGQAAEEFLDRVLAEHLDRVRRTARWPPGIRTPWRPRKGVSPARGHAERQSTLPCSEPFEFLVLVKVDQTTRTPPSQDLGRASTERMKPPGRYVRRCPADGEGPRPERASNSITHKELRPAVGARPATAPWGRMERDRGRDGGPTDVIGSRPAALDFSHSG